ncbi:unnamed protein product [Amoebophrya sp. A120]|nr:unnamed protein product [Amoebophrya sp. A120]|eukprot:GSA120T00003231001.1
MVRFGPGPQVLPVGLKFGGPRSSFAAVTVVQPPSSSVNIKLRAPSARAGRWNKNCALQTGSGFCTASRQLSHYCAPWTRSSTAKHVNSRSDVNPSNIHPVVIRPRAFRSSKISSGFQLVPPSTSISARQGLNSNLCFFSPDRKFSSSATAPSPETRMQEDGKVDVYVVGFGVPGRSMAWFHCEQLRRGLIPNARLAGIIEPGLGLAKNAKDVPVTTWQFGDLSAKEKNEIQIVKSVADLVPRPGCSDLSPVVRGKSANEVEQQEFSSCAVVACRTVDMCDQLRQLVDHGIRCIYLEKPGAFSAKELEQAKEYADRFGAKVYLGYNRNVAPYLQKSVSYLSDFAQRTGVTPKNVKDQQELVFHCEHFNTYQPKDLFELCFARNPEGILKNMAIHELMIAVAFFGFKVDDLKDVRILNSKFHSFAGNTTGQTNSLSDHANSVLAKLDGDFSFLDFQLVHKDPDVPVFQITADRCGGDVVRATVASCCNRQKTYKILYQSSLDSGKPVGPALGAVSSAAGSPCWMTQYPDMMPYLRLQADTYRTLKEKVCFYSTSSGADFRAATSAAPSRSAIASSSGGGGKVATIEDGVEALRLAEHLESLFKHAANSDTAEFDVEPATRVVHARL